jgi:thiamine transport system permease protein
MDRHRALSRGAGAALAVLPALFLGYFFAYPLVSILATGLTVDGRPDLGPLGDVFTRPRLAGVAWFTLWQAVASTVLTLAVALPATAAFARYRFPGKHLIRAGLTVPFVLPTVVVASAFLALLGPGGPFGIDLRRTVWAILAAHVFYNVAVVVRTVGASWERLDPRLEEAARTLGATRWQAFRRVTWPLVRPAVISASSIVFLFTFTSFGVILILGGFQYATLETEIWRQATALIDFRVAAALALLQLVGVSAILLAYSRAQERRSRELPLVPTVIATRPPGTRAERWFVALSVGTLVIGLATPLGMLVERSLRVGDGYGWAHFRGLASSDAGSALFVPPTTAIANSLWFALGATLLAVVVGLLAAATVAYRRGRLSRWFDALLMLPLGTSAVTIGFGYLVALDEPVDLRTSALLIPIAHAVVAIPFVVRTTVPVMRGVRRRLREAAAVLGAPPAMVWRRVDLPLVSRAALVGAAFAFAVSLGEFGATAFIARPDRPTLPIAIFRFLGQPGAANFGRAMAMSVVLMVVTGTVVLAIDRFRVGHVGEF